ncbi:Protein F14F9.5 [Aphelenchoides avenae]|nr:Protein F14F9.5 [Aphelenchus avenae]
MTFNIWLSGASVENGVEKIAKHIKQVNPDVVALQEVYPDALGNIMVALGPGWTGIESRINESYSDTAFITRHQFLEDERAETNWAFGMPLKVSNKLTINMWNLHLYPWAEGQKAVNNKMVTTAEQLMAGETCTKCTCERGPGPPFCGRVQNVQEVLSHESFRDAVNATEKRPLLVFGDFNSPSPLDYTGRTKHLHGGWVFKWPAIQMLLDFANLKDSYREVHPDELAEPGVTWSTVWKQSGAERDWTVPEPQDRIDFILYRGAKLQAVNSFTYAGNQPVHPLPDVWHNDYPSDHFAVITDYVVRP